MGGGQTGGDGFGKEGRTQRRNEYHKILHTHNKECDGIITTTYKGLRPAEVLQCVNKQGKGTVGSFAPIKMSMMWSHSSSSNKINAVFVCKKKASFSLHLPSPGPFGDLSDPSFVRPC